MRRVIRIKALLIGISGGCAIFALFSATMALSSDAEAPHFTIPWVDRSLAHPETFEPGGLMLRDCVETAGWLCTLSPEASQCAPELAQAFRERTARLKESIPDSVEGERYLNRRLARLADMSDEVDFTACLNMSEEVYARYSGIPLDRMTNCDLIAAGNHLAGVRSLYNHAVPPGDRISAPSPAAPKFDPLVWMDTCLEIVPDGDPQMVQCLGTSLNGCKFAREPEHCVQTYQTEARARTVRNVEVSGQPVGAPDCDELIEPSGPAFHFRQFLESYQGYDAGCGLTADVVRYMFSEWNLQ